MICRWLLLTVLLTGITHAEDPGNPQHGFQQRLDHAAALSTAAPWRESQAVLDELRSELPHANAFQQAEFAWLETRNLALSGDLSGALKASRALLERPLTPQQRLKTYRLAANVALIARRFDEAFIHLNHGLRLLADSSLETHSEGLHSLAGYAYTLVGEVEQGIHFGQLAVQYAEQSGTERDLCSACQRLAFAHKVSGDNEASLAYYRRALAHCLTAGDPLIAGIVRYGMGDLLRQAGDISEAESLFIEALDSLEAHDFHSGIAEARLYYARLEMARGHLDHVLDLLNPTLEPLGEAETWDYLAEAHGMLGKVARARGDYQTAFNHHDLQLRIQRQSHDQERSRRVTFLEVEFNLLHNQQQLALLEDQARVSRLEETARLQQQQIRKFAFGLAGLLMVCLALLLLHTMRERRRYQTLSERDGLTGTLNHTSFFAVAEREIQIAVENQQSFWMLLADIDHFKQVNDRHGHLVGDNILRQVGRCLRRCFDQHGAIGRIGGEEFAVTLRGKNRTEIDALLEQFREALTRRDKQDSSISVTMSFGLARQFGPTDPLLAIRQRADEALYQAKHKGRDRVVHHVGEQETGPSNAH